MCSRASSQRPEEQEDEQKEGEKGQVSNSFPLLKIGTLVVIGAMAANVFGFKYSRWAVGKEIHRGWETHARNVARQAARERAKARKTQSRGYTSAREQEARARAEEQARHTRREQKGRKERDNTRRAYRRWEQTFSNNGYQQRVRVEFDSRFEDFFKGGPFGMPEEVLREFLRAAQTQTRRGRTEDFDAFRFWEEIHGAEWRQASGGMGGSGRMGGSGGMGSGAFSGNRARHYAALGIGQNASPGEVKAAYRREVMKWHPDRYRGPDRAGAEKRFREVTEAYEALK